MASSEGRERRWVIYRVRIANRVGEWQVRTEPPPEWMDAETVEVVEAPGEGRDLPRTDEASREYAPSEIEQLQSRLRVAVEALREIRAEGKVCDNYELCDHRACQSSYAAWAIADKALASLSDRDEP